MPETSRLAEEYFSQSLRIIQEIIEEVLIEEAGRSFFQREEGFKLLLNNALTDGGWKSWSDFEKLFAKYGNEDIDLLTKALILWFELTNLAEENYRKLLARTERERQDQTFEKLMTFAKTNGLTPLHMIELMHKSQLQLSFSPHPTNRRKSSFLLLLNELGELLERATKPLANITEYEKLREEIKARVIILWGISETRAIRRNAFDSLRNSLFYFDKVLFKAISATYERLNDVMQFALGGKSRKIGFSLPIFFEFSYTLGDSTPHRLIPAELPYITILLQKSLVLRKYVERINDLLAHLPLSATYFPVTPELAESVENDEALFPDFVAATKGQNIDEVYRRKLDFIRLKLENSLIRVNTEIDDLGYDRQKIGYNPYVVSIPSGYHYKRSQELLKDLKLVQSSLKKHPGKILAKQMIHPLIEDVRIFGFHLAPLDIIIEKKFFYLFLDELFSHNGYDIPSAMNEEFRKNVFLKELNKLRPLGASILAESKKLSGNALHFYNLMSWIQTTLEDVSPRSIQSLIINKCSSSSDILAALLVCKEVGILKISPNKVDYMGVDLIPSFGCRSCITNSEEIFEDLFSIPIYRQIIHKKKRVQAVMLNYSDFSKAYGYLEANYILLITQQRLSRLGQIHRIKFKFFHGRGGILGRGSYPASMALLSLPAPLTEHLQILEVGEAVPSKYSNLYLAMDNFENIIYSSLMKKMNSKLHKKTEEFDVSAMDALAFLADHSTQSYQQLVQRQDFIQFFIECSPVDMIDFFLERNPYATIDPLKEGRKIQDVNTTSWVFSWNLMRINLSTYFGVGTALKQYVELHGIQPLQRLYREWDFFKSLIDNLQMVMLKTDIRITSKFAVSASHSHKAILRELVKEFELTQSMVLKIVENNELLENTAIRRTVLQRRKYLDPLCLHLIQLLYKWRKTNRPKEHENHLLLKDLEESINAISTGLRNTG